MICKSHTQPSESKPYRYYSVLEKPTPLGKNMGNFLKRISALVYLGVYL